jgi:hypothetical protein
MTRMCVGFRYLSAMRKSDGTSPIREHRIPFTEVLLASGTAHHTLVSIMQKSETNLHDCQAVPVRKAIVWGCIGAHQVGQ